MMVRNGLNPDPMPYTLKLLVIHCTATPAGREVSAEEIRRWHTAPPNEGGRGWKQVGYTDMVHLDGTVERLVANNEDDVVDPWEITKDVYKRQLLYRTESLGSLFSRFSGQRIA